MIELISLRHDADDTDRGPPILFVPGALTGAWIWRDTFMPWFFDAGHDVYAMSFRGHGKRGLRLNRHGLDDFVADLEEAIDSLPDEPVLIAHSLGGFVTLRILEQRTLPCAMLLSPVPPDGVLRSLLHLGRKSPLSVAKLLSVAIDPRVTTLGRPPSGIYSDNADPVAAEKITDRLQAESLRALGGLILPRKIDPGRIDTPMHFYGAEGDHVVPPAEVRRAAQTFAAPVGIFPGMSHTYQAEPGWQQVAEQMLRWLNTVLQDARPALSTPDVVAC